MKPNTFMIASLCCALFLTAPTTADSFECTRTKNYDFVSLRWEQAAPIKLAVRANPNRRTDIVLLENAIAASLNSWSEPSCSSLDFEYIGEVSADRPLSEVSQVISISEDWQADDSVVGLTTMTYTDKTGLIRYGKIELNEVDFVFIDALPDGACTFSRQYDLQSVLTHEIGHLIGLAHLSVEDALLREELGEDPATMSRAVDSCTIDFRTLEADDLEAACYVYPAGQNSRSCATLPLQQTPFATNEPFSCQALGSNSPGEAFIYIALILFGILSRMRSRDRLSTD
ncbi:MAG: matrixin family metalloprotease [Myxococcota bacterium]|nr:matrixin family metalloprotease [Myxococcota bacterium]